MANVDHISRGGFSVVEPVRNFFAALSESFVASRKYRKTYNELDALTSRDLNDLGLTRSDIARVAYDAVYGEGVSEYRGR